MPSKPSCPAHHWPSPFSRFCSCKILEILSDKCGPLMQIRLGAAHFIVVSDAAVAKEVLKANELNFLCRPQLDSTVPTIYSGSSFISAPYGPYWRFLKKLCMTRLLSTSQLSQFLHVREDEINKLVESLIVVSREGGVCDLKRVLKATTNNVICRMMMSTTCSGNADEAEEAMEIVDEVMKIQAKVGFANTFGPLAKLDPFGYKRKFAKILEKFDEMMERIIWKHKEKIKDAGEVVMDLMDILLAISKEEENAEVKLTRKDIKAVLLDMFMAGTETSSNAIEWTLAELINHPNILEKVREEIDSVVGSNRMVKESDVPNLPYLQAVVKESLRLHIPAPFVLRESIEDCKINGFDLKGNTPVLINAYAIMRDPQSWTDPNEFIPERFVVNCPNDINPVLREIDMKGQHFSYVPFGSGRRACPGASLALTVIHATLGALVQCFDWKTKDGNKVGMQEAPGAITLTMERSLVCYHITRFNPFEMD